MHEELIEKLRCCVEQIRCGDCRYVKDCDGDRMLMSQAADAIEELSNCRAAEGGNMMAFKDLAFKPPIYAIRVKSCGNDWVTDCDATLTADKIRGFSLDSDGVHIYSRERDIHGDYDNVYVPYTNLEALVFYFSEPPKEE